MAAQSSILTSISYPYNNSKKSFANTNVTRPINIHVSLGTPSALARNLSQDHEFKISSRNDMRTHHPAETTAAKLYALLDAVADRVEMHTNIGEQRNNWNSLLLNSINMMTLTATTMAGVTAAAGAAQPVFALKLSSTLLFAAATGLLLVVNKLQPSQLVEEQRNATRLFKQLHAEIETIVALRDHVTEIDVKYLMERVLALDKAYPLPLIGVMLEKFPAKLVPAKWWPLKVEHEHDELVERNKNGWSEEMENEMMEIVHVLKEKDKQDYIRLGNTALKLNKILSILGPVLTGVAATSSAFSGTNALAIAVGAGVLSTIVNSIEHGGQVGMVFEMYRNCAGFFQLMEETIESSIGECDVNTRENGELMEMKVSLWLGRSLSELKELAMASATSRGDGISPEEFASKLL